MFLKNQFFKNFSLSSKRTFLLFEAMKLSKAFCLVGFVFVIATVVSCGVRKNGESVKGFDEQAHRGGRGLMPENTIASEENAIRFNATLEMDLQMSKDGKILVSHDAYFSSDFCLTPEGQEMSKKQGYTRILHQMDYDSITKYDVGLKPHPLFPRQKKMHAVKPLLSVLIDSVEAFAKARHHVNHYNIEIKSSPAADGKYYPDLTTYVDAAMKIVLSKAIAARTMIQSFDIRALQMVHQKYPQVQTSYLVGEKDVLTAEGYLKNLGFKPDIFSPEYHIVTPALLKGFHDKGIKVIVWTPNTLAELKNLKDMGVDGAITDYPDLYKQL